jgi:hypothetical protein
VASGLCIAKDFVTVFNNELYSVVFGVHVGHFTFQAVVSHNSRCEDDGQVLRCHLHHRISVCLLLREQQKNGRQGLTKFSLSLTATRARWKIKNSRQSRCLGGSMLKVFLRCVQRSLSSSIAKICVS